MNRIKEIRAFVGISQKELASMSEISQPYLYDLENNRRGAKPETLERIAKALGCTINDLLIEERRENGGQGADGQGYTSTLRMQPEHGKKVREADAAYGRSADHMGKRRARMGAKQDGIP